MEFQKQPGTHTPESLAASFRDLTLNELDASMYEDLELTLRAAGFEKADQNSVARILTNNQLLCRSENFSRTLNLLTGNQPLEIENKRQQANMCTMSGAEGFRTAMTEGFSGKDVSGTVKVVLTFHTRHVTTQPIPKEDDLWKYKPNTAAVSVSGTGTIKIDDVEMVSFRFPIHLYPENKLSESELEQLEEGGIQFVVRHYTQEKTAH